MMKEYKIVGEFTYNNTEMLVVRKSGSASVIPREEFEDMLTREHRYRAWRRKCTA